MIILEDDKQYPENCSSLFFHHLRILSLRKEVMGMLGEFENILASWTLPVKMHYKNVVSL